MIADCAVDPEVFATWQHFRSLQEDFGVSRGRLISKFPKKWATLVMEHAWRLAAEEGGNRVTTDLQAKAIEERLFRSERFKRKLKSPGGRAFDPTQSWVDNAIAASPGFDLIISSGSGASGNRMGADDILKDEHPFRRGTQGQVRRRREELVGVVEPLLQGCVEVVVVDPNFRPDVTRFTRTLIRLIDRINANGRSPKRLEVHANRVQNRSETFDREWHLSQWRNRISSDLPKGWQLTVCYWDQLPSGGKPHARFILTEAGGIHFDHGVDEGDGETLVTLLEDEVWESLYKTFDTGSLPADFDPGQHVLTLTA